MAQHEDEISGVLEQFQPRPMIADTARRRGVEFSSVVYNDGKLILFYLHQRLYPLKFEIIIKSKILCCLERSCKELESPLDQIVQSLNSSSLSLSSIVSKLLLLLETKLPLVTGKKRIKRLIKQQQSIFDFQILLLRCAAVGNNRSTFCIPSPTGYSQGWKYNEQDELAAFYQSLPWLDQGRLKVTEKDSKHGFHVCFELKNDITPRFKDLQNQHGSQTVFHGTKMDRVWSILNCGFLNLSNGRFCKNGAIMGDGVYFSHSLSVATFFATTQDNVHTYQRAWNHPSLMRLLGINQQQQYTVSCYPVLEAEIIHPRSKCTRQEGKYYVVPNTQDIHITKVHLTMELRSKSFSSNALWVVLLIGFAIMWFYS